MRVSLSVRISHHTVYPVKAYVSTCSNVVVEVDNVLPPGSKLLIVDSYYDSNEAMRIASERGYSGEGCWNASEDAWSTSMGFTASSTTTT